MYKFKQNITIGVYIKLKVIGSRTVKEKIISDLGAILDKYSGVKSVDDSRAYEFSGEVFNLIQFKYDDQFCGRDDEFGQLIDDLLTSSTFIHDEVGVEEKNQYLADTINTIQKLQEIEVGK